MKSKTLIDKQVQRKRNPELFSTVMAAKKQEAWLNVAGILAGPTRTRMDINLTDLNEGAKAGDKILITGKVLSQGNVDKKFKVIALAFSEKAKEKLLKAGCEVSYVIDEIKSNPSQEGIKVLRK